MFYMQPSEIPVPRNPMPTTSGTVPATSPLNANGERASLTAPLYVPEPPQAPHQPGQIPQTVLEEISKTPPRSIVQITAYNTVHEGEFRYIKNGPKFTVLDSVELTNPVLLPGRQPIPVRTQ